MDNWRESLPEDLRENETLSRFGDVSDLAKSFLETKKALSSSNRLPTKESDEATRQEIFSKIQEHYPEVVILPEREKPFSEQSPEFKAMWGVPESDDDYSPPEDLKGMPDDVVGNFRKWSHEAGLNRDQFQYLVGQMAENHGAMIEEMDGKMNANTAKVKAKLGDAYDQFEDTLGILAEQFEDGDYPLDTTDPGIRAALSVPAVKMLLFNVMKDALGEGERLSALVTDKPLSKSVSDLQMELKDLMRSSDYLKGQMGELPRAEWMELLDRRFKLQDKIEKATA